MKISQVVGIDLGTTNSAVAIVDRAQKEIISYENKNGQKAIPSVVAFDSRKKEFVVGTRAFNRRGTNPEPIVSIKRKMGTTETVRLGEQDLLPEEVSAKILAECKKLMEDQLNEIKDEFEYVVDRAVITVPAYFGLNAVEATRKAGELAGLEVVEVLQEPTAAAVFYSWKHKIEDGNFMVYDLGGGTFDVSIVRKIADIPLVVGVSGNNFLGGDNFDHKLARVILNRLQDPELDYSLDLDLDQADDRNRFTKLILEAECIKKALSTDGSVFWQKAGVFSDHNGANVNIDFEFLREDFENLIREMVDSTIPECQQALEESVRNASITIEDIDYILLVGGSTKIPLIFNIVKETFCPPAEPSAECEEPVIYEPDMAVGYGAAIRAAGYPAKIMNDDQSVAVNFETVRNPDSSYSIKGNVVIADKAAAPYNIARLRLTDIEGNLIGESSIDEEGNYEVTNVKVDENALADMNFSFIDADDNKVIDFNEIVKPPASGPTTILSKSIYIDIYNPDSKEVEKKILLEKGLTLPVEGEYTFYTYADNSRKLSLNLYENYTLLKEIEVEFDHDVPKGTPVNLTLYISQTFVITAKGEVAGKSFDAVIEIPEVEVPAMEYYESLKNELDEVIGYMEPGDQALFKAKKRNLCLHIADAYLEKENQKIIEYVDKLRELIHEARQALPKPIEPSRESFDRLSNEVIDLIEHAKEQGKESPITLEALRAHQSEGHAAYECNDQRQVTECVRQLEAMKHNLKELLDPGGKPQIEPWQLAFLLCTRFIPEKLDELSAKLAEHNNTEYAEEIKGMRREADSYLPQISPMMDQNEAIRIVQNCQRIFLNIDRIFGSIGVTKAEGPGIHIPTDYRLS